MTCSHSHLPPGRVRRSKRHQCRDRTLPWRSQGHNAKTAPALTPPRGGWEKFMKPRLAHLKGGSQKAGLFLRRYAPLFWFSLLLAVFGFMLADRI